MPRFFVLSIIIVASLTSTTLMAANADRFQFNHDIRIQADDEVGDVTCLNCSVYVLGKVAGDVTAFNGNVVAEPGAAISGDVTTIHGNSHIENGTQVAGDLTAIAGTVRRDPQATVGGDVTSMGGGGWVFLSFCFRLSSSEALLP